MILSVHIGSKSIPLQFISNFVYSSDIFSLHNTATLSIKDISKDLFNHILIGTPVFINFSDESSKKSYAIHMSVLSFAKVPAPQSSAIDEVALNLVSYWYFNSAIHTQAHSGCVSTIVQTIFDKNYRHVVTHILPTNDTVALRYQIEESTQNFMTRIIQYGIRDNLPIYLYSNAMGEVELKGLSDFSNETPTHVCVPDLALRNDEDSALPNVQVIRMRNFTFASDNLTTSSVTKTNFTTAHFTASKIVNTSVILSSSEIDSDQSEVYTPKSVNFTGWEYTPDDALALTLHRNFEKNIKVLYLNGDFDGILIDELNVGKRVNVLLPFKPTIGIHSGKEVNLGEGTYTVKHLDLMYNDNTYSTQATLINT